MTKSHHARSWLSALAFAAIFGSSLVGGAPPGHATNGFLSHCIGAYGCGMGGAGVALPSDATNSGINPALMARLGNEAIVSPSWFHPVRTIDLSNANAIVAPFPAPVPNTAAGEQTSSKEDFIEGGAGFNTRIAPDFTVGLSIYGQGGMSTSYDRSRINPAFQTPPTGYDRQVLYRLAHFVPTVTWQPNAHSAYGLGLILGYSDIKMDFATLPAFAQTAGRNQRDSAFGVGVRVGGLWDIGNQFSVGATVASPTWFESFEKYNDVFLGPINTPPNGAVGVAWHVTPQTDIAFDVKYIAWSSVTAIGTQPALGGFGWRDRFVFLVGGQHKVSDNLTLRAGYNYSESPIPDQNIFANSLFPAIVEHHITVGGTYKLAAGWELTGSAFYVPKAEQTDPGTGDLFSAVGRGTKVDMWQVGAQIGLKWRF